MYEIIKDEIQLLDNECCIVFDFGCYFPYANFEILTFDFSLGMEEFEDYKINHRYRNKNYQTISKKYGRKVSKVGYPYILKLDEQIPFLLSLKVGIKKQYITIILPIETNMTKDKPICGLSLRYNFDKSQINFMSHEKNDNGGWYTHTWKNYQGENDRKGDNDILLDPPCEISNNTILYENVIEPCPVTFSNLLL